MDKTELTAKELCWLSHFLATLNATSAAAACYETELYDSCRSIGHQNYVKMRPLIDERLREILPSPEMVVERLSAIAFCDLGPYLNADGTIDVDGLIGAELSFMIRGVRPVRDGVAWELEDRLEVVKLLGRYFRLLNSDVTVHLEQQDTPTLDVLAALTEQVAALEEQDTAERAAAAAE